MTDNITHHLNESADKITVKLNVKRGSGTRDQDKGTIKCKGDSPEAVAKEIEGTLDELEDRNIFERESVLERYREGDVPAVAPPEEVETDA